MSLLNTNSNPAERMRGITFSENFESAQKVVANGGAIEGTPVINNGVTLDGTNDYILYVLTGNELNNDELSFVFDFVPEFDTDEDEQRAFIDSDTGDRFLLYKQNNAGSNTLTIYLGGTSIVAIAEATYSPYWLVNQRNVLVVSGTSGDTSAWLNGTKILNSSATAWSPSSSPLEFFVGSNKSGGINFKGCINSFKVFKSLLTEQEAIDFYNGTTYSYMNDAVVNLPMGACQHDPSNTLARTLDISGNENHGILGDGSTTTILPTKLSKRGYSFDGNDYIAIPDTKLGNSSHTFSALFKNEGYALARIINSYPGGSATNGLYVSGTTLTYSIYDSVLSASLGGNVNIGAVVHAVGTYNSDTKEYALYIDGVQINSDTYAGGDINIDYIDIGTLEDTFVQYLTGEVYNARVLKCALTPLQVASLHINLMSNINQV